LITSRDPPNLQVTLADERDIEYSLAMSEDRTLWKQQRAGRHPKRYKATIKQVVGGIFSGLSNKSLEDEIVQDLISVSRENLEDPAQHQRKRAALWDKTLDPLLNKLKVLMRDRVSFILDSIASKLLDTNTTLHWDQRTNNCQNFCEALIEPSVFGSLLAPRSDSQIPNALYLMSFVCRPGSYAREKVQTKFSVPNGLTEEYLLKFRYGWHVESDIIDALQEYWYDWGAFGGPLYRYQDIFPWDCTEAYGRSNTTCNDCNIAKHVWSFPFDSWSIIALHLTRDRLSYPTVRSKQDWMCNRLKILLAQDVLLTAATVMAQSTAFRRATSWISMHPDPKMDRLKLGGIHRAQPFSHHFEQDGYNEYFIAEWAHLHRDDQIAAYEALRNLRSILPDIPVSVGGLYTGSSSDRDNDEVGDGGYAWDTFGCYFDDGWDGAYTQDECIDPGTADADVNGADDAESDAGGDVGDDDAGDDAGGDGGGCCGGGCGDD
jgi:hypothetical protein